MPPRIAVVGGGITGLSTCFHLEKLGVRNITLFDPGDRIGGKLQTESHRGFLVEGGPDSIFIRKQETLDFIDQIGLRDELIEPRARGFSLYLDGALRTTPGGVARITNIDPDALEKFDYLSSQGKTEALAERTISPNFDEDESIASFFRRRFGREYAVKIAEPLYAGTHGGEAEHLSMEALFPGFRQMEREFGSLTAASEATASEGSARFISFKRGSHLLVSATLDQLSATSWSRRAVEQLGFSSRSVSLDGEKFDAVVLAIPAERASALLLRASPEASSLLARISFSSSIIVTFGFSKSDQDLGLTGTGFLVPATCDSEVRGGTWSSSKWSHRSTGGALVRIFLRWQDARDEVLVQLAKSELQRVTGIDDVPEFEQVMRWKHGLPQYRLGHLRLIDEIEGELRNCGRVFIAGQSYRGAGIPDCIRQGREVAEALLQNVQGVSADDIASLRSS